MGPAQLPGTSTILEASNVVLQRDKSAEKYVEVLLSDGYVQVEISTSFLIDEFSSINIQFENWCVVTSSLEGKTTLFHVNVFFILIYCNIFTEPF